MCRVKVRKKQNPFCFFVCFYLIKESCCELIKFIALSNVALTLSEERGNCENCQVIGEETNLIKMRLGGTKTKKKLMLETV